MSQNTHNISGVRSLVAIFIKDMTDYICMYERKQIQDPPNIFFFLENAKKETPEYFLKFLFLFESTILPFNNGK